MANISKIQFLRTSVANKVPAASELDEGSIGINMADRKIFTKDASGAIIPIGQSLDNVYSKTDSDSRFAPLSNFSMSGNDAHMKSGNSGYLFMNADGSAGVFNTSAKWKFDPTGNLTIGMVPITTGGTGATTASGARTNLGLGSGAVTTWTLPTVTTGKSCWILICSVTTAGNNAGKLQLQFSGLDNYGNSASSYSILDISARLGSSTGLTSDSILNLKRAASNLDNISFGTAYNSTTSAYDVYMKDSSGWQNGGQVSILASANLSTYFTGGIINGSFPITTTEPSGMSYTTIKSLGSNLVNGSTLISGEFISTNGNGIRIAPNTAPDAKSLLIRNDGGVTYFMISDNGPTPGNNWNGIFPLTIDMISGDSTFSKNVVVNSSLTVGGPAYFNSFNATDITATGALTSNSLSVTNTITSSGLNVAAAATIGSIISNGDIVTKSGNLFGADSTHYLALGSSASDSSSWGSPSGNYNFTNTTSGASRIKFSDGAITAAGSITTSSDIIVSNDNTGVIVGNNADIGLIKKNGSSGKFVVGSNNNFTVGVSDNSRIGSTDNVTTIFNVNQSGNTTVYGTLSVAGSTSVKALSTTGITNSGNLTVNGTGSFGGSLGAAGLSSSSGLTVSSGSTNIQGLTATSLLVNGAITTTAGITTPAAKVNGNLTSTGTVVADTVSAVTGNFSGKITSNSLTTSNITVNGASTINNTPDTWTTIQGVYTGGNAGSNRQVNGLRILGNGDLKVDIYEYENIGVSHGLNFHVSGGGNEGYYQFDNAGKFSTTGQLAGASLSITNDAYIGGTMSANVVTQRSDINHKRDLKEVSGLSALNEITGYTYELQVGDTDTWNKSVGVIAQDVQKVCPEAVLTEKDGSLSLNYNSVIAILVNSVKEISKERDELSARLDSLEYKVSQL